VLLLTYLNTGTLLSHDRLYLANLLRFQTASGSDLSPAIPIFCIPVFSKLAGIPLLAVLSWLKQNAADRSLNKELSLSLVNMPVSLAVVRKSVG
jgi:hypothetical protein